MPTPKRRGRAVGARGKALSRVAGTGNCGLLSTVPSRVCDVTGPVHRGVNRHPDTWPLCALVNRRVTPAAIRNSVLESGDKMFKQFPPKKQ